MEASTSAWDDGGSLTVPQAFPCAPPHTEDSTKPDEGVWVFVPTNLDCPPVAETNPAERTAARALRGYVRGRAAGAKSWLKSRVSSLIPPGQAKHLSGVAGAARSVCDVVAERPDLALLALGTGAGLACVATKVLLQGGFVYCCFIPHFIFNSGGASSGGCEHCEACRGKQAAETATAAPGWEGAASNGAFANSKEAEAAAYNSAGTAPGSAAAHSHEHHARSGTSPSLDEAVKAQGGAYAPAAAPQAPRVEDWF
ncbi:hypothetical protein JKP88DRAFT_218557 [Tribonema minus]|uniref:Uncharacterized protein n=1 Tax=Tribonema minus TaxID=303371 RepID=A0A835Z4X1_9STRA|nr:hypothetical protein JKP88DRAFT_218557 [Tribonema minus]